jgi:hypothetical protein
VCISFRITFLKGGEVAYSTPFVNGKWYIVRLICQLIMMRFALYDDVARDTLLLENPIP